MWYISVSSMNSASISIGQLGPALDVCQPAWHKKPPVSILRQKQDLALIAHIFTISNSKSYYNTIFWMPLVILCEKGCRSHLWFDESPHS